MGDYENFTDVVLAVNARRTPRRTALRAARDGRSHYEATFEELERRVAAVAHGLAAHGIGAGDRVASLVADLPGLVELYLAQARVGSPIVGLNQRWPLELLVAAVEAAAPTAVVHDDSVAHLLPYLRRHLPGVGRWLRLDAVAPPWPFAAVPEVGLDGFVDPGPPVASGGDRELGLFFTSGTSGRPKAIVHSHASALANTGIWVDVDHDEGSSLVTGPVIWGMGFPCVVAPALAIGMTVVLEDPLAPVPFLDVVSRERITHVNVLPSFWSSLLREPDFTGVGLGSLDVVLLGGEPVLPALVERLARVLPRAQLFTFYGQTEAPFSCIGRLDAGARRAPMRARHHTAARVVDTDGRSVVGAIGTLELTGRQVARGRLGEGGEVVPVTRGGWFATDDLATISPAGEVTIVGRRQEAVLRRGQWFHPSELEDAALSLRGVAEAGAAAVEVAGGEPRVLLAVVPDAGAAIDAAWVRARLAEQLDAGLVPDLVVVAGELPHADDASGGPGKLQRSRLVERFGGALHLGGVAAHER